jgi:hypothetical protein
MYIFFGYREIKMKWTDRITNDEVFQRAKEERLLSIILTPARRVNAHCSATRLPIAFEGPIWDAVPHKNKEKSECKISTCFSTVEPKRHKRMATVALAHSPGTREKTVM